MSERVLMAMNGSPAAPGGFEIYLLRAGKGTKEGLLVSCGREDGPAERGRAAAKVFAFIGSARVFCARGHDLRAFMDLPRPVMTTVMTENMRELSRTYTPEKARPRSDVFRDNLGEDPATDVRERAEQMARILPDVAPETDEYLDIARKMTDPAGRPEPGIFKDIGKTFRPRT